VTVPVPTCGSYVCHGVTWSTGRPCLLLAPLPDGPLICAPVMHQRVAFQTTGDGLWCTGRYRFADTVRVEPRPCPQRAPAVRGGQCVQCENQDDFRFAHHFHRGGGPVSSALAAYMAQPHWLYAATFANGATKVGTAAEPRKHSRLAEQGALLATYLAGSDDGRTVRLLEDAVSRQLGVGQSMRSAAKLKALASLRDLGPARTAHERHVATAAQVLADLGVPAVIELWTPPSEGGLLRSGGAGRILYPHDVREGEHGFTVVSCVGSQVLAVLDADLQCLLDLGALKGRRVAFGPFHSPDIVVQAELF